VSDGPDLSDVGGLVLAWGDALVSAGVVVLSCPVWAAT
jgi:hypothetical protein